MADYMYKYADGSTGTSPWKTGADGKPLLNSAGGMLEEGSFLGTANGQGGYTPGLNANAGMGIFGMSSPATQTPQVSGGSSWGGGSTAGDMYSTKPMQVNPYSTSSGGGYGAPTGQNPYLRDMGDAMVNQMTTNFNRNVMPAISSQAIANGNYGGSRQGVIEANAMNDLNQNMANGLAGLYGSGFNSSLNYDLGRRSNDLGFASLDHSIDNSNRNWQLQGANFGLGIYDRLQQGNQAGINAGTTINNQPLDYWRTFSDAANSMGQGYGTSTSSQKLPGNPFMSAVGGMGLGNQIGGMFSQNSWNKMPNSNVYIGTGSMGD